MKRHSIKLKSNQGIKFFLTIAISIYVNGLHSQTSHHPVHFGFGNQWNYGIKFPDNTSYQPYGKGTFSSYAFEVHAGIPLGPFNITPSYSTSLPLRQILLHNPNGSDVPDGYNISVPYQDDQSFSYYLYGDDHESTQSYSEVFQNMLGSNLTIAIRNNWGEVEIGTGLFRRTKKAWVYTPIIYDEYEYYSSTGTEWDNYFYSDTYSTYNEKVELFTQKSWAVPVVLNFCSHYGHIYYGGGTSWFPGKDSFWSFRYNMGVQF